MYKVELSHNRFSAIPPVLSQLPPLRSLDLRGNPWATCPLPLPWHIDRYVYPTAADSSSTFHDWQHRFDDWLLSPRTQPEHTDLPFLDLCPE